ncbi:rho guanine nucleotide exchange factor 8-like [Canna indica]|uniref:Rho guanine nucleotide exchange factor 8-like n=1 Tax=Canna indica TaxID=4628 RepID=A0AAQ3JRD6_9LILI|nr:rho guanine nucleotide exchange factor 8-like [Canna indica]
MVRFLKRGHGERPEQSDDETCDLGTRHTQSEIPEGAGLDGPSCDDNGNFNGQGAGAGKAQLMLERSSGVGTRSWPGKDGGAKEKPKSEMDSMKDRFAKLLLGEDMSGGGKGVSSALALSNAITNLAASVFGEQWRLEPMSAERKARWKKEIDCLLSVTDYIVEFAPCKQTTKDGLSMEVMRTRQRRDLQVNIPSLRNLDSMLIGYLDEFKDKKEFWYVSRDADESEKGNAQRKDDKWWLPTVRVPPNGLSEDARTWLQYQKESVNQVLKAAMAINAHVLMEMDVPEAYVDSLPKNGRASLGDAIYKRITDDVFDPGELLESMDLSSEHKVLDLKNRIEASIVIWERKLHDKECKSSTWGSAVSLEKRGLFEERAETLLLLIKQRFPGLPQSTLDVSKIQYNKDVGLSILESYSRVLESLAFTVMSRIDDVFYADSFAQDPSSKDPNKRRAMAAAAQAKKLEREDESASMTLSDFMGWNFEQEPELAEKNAGDPLKKLPEVKANRFSYIDKIEHEGGMRSPTARH